MVWYMAVMTVVSMPRKEWRLLARDISFYVSGGSDAAQTMNKPGHWTYPLDWSYQLKRPDDYFLPCDDEGIPLRDLPGRIERQYLPSRIAAYALANWNEHVVDGSEMSRQRFLSCCNWFASQPEGAFRHEFMLVGMEAGWLSCIAQGEGISVLVRGYKLTGESYFAEAAIRAAAWLSHPVEGGGLLDHLPDGYPFLEEYPLTQYRHVLNGCLYATVGLDDLVLAGLDRTGEFTELRDGVVSGIAANLPRWEIGNWTTYDFRANFEDDNPPNPNTLTYQNVHWILLDHLGHRLNKDELLAAALRWRNASASTTQRLKALFGKIAYRFSHGYGT